MNKCKYCECAFDGTKDIKNIASKVIQGFPGKIVFSAYVGSNKKLNVFVCNQSGEGDDFISASINYCPMCGRKLND